MFIDLKECSKQRIGNDKALRWFADNYPSGVDFSKVVEDVALKEDPIGEEFCDWCADWLDLSEQDIQLYKESRKIINSKDVFASRNIIDSSGIRLSKNVEKSKLIVGSTDIESSENISYSKDVGNSINVRDSSFIYNSNEIVSGINCTDSKIVRDGSFIVSSSNIYKSSNIENSNCIFYSENISDSILLSNCHNVKNAILCNNLNDSDSFMIFNKPVSSAVFNIVKHQFEKLFSGRLKMHWIDSVSTIQSFRYDHFFDDEQSSFWNWMTTLPNYNPTILYSITLCPKALD